MLLPPTFIAGLLPEAFKPEFIEDKNCGQKISFPLCSYLIVVDSWPWIGVLTSGNVPGVAWGSGGYHW